MSANQQDLDPDSTTDMEVVIDTEEELIKECEEIWKDMEKVSIKIIVMYQLNSIRSKSISVVIRVRKKIIC
jgi:hypothetical protein